MRASLGVAFLCSMLAAGPVAAVDLINLDSTPHTLEVVEWGEVFAFTILPGVTLAEVCLVCTVRVATGGTVTAEDNDIVVIREGVPRVGG
jgi:hypothetical protein